MLTGRKFLFPSLDLLLPGERVCLHDSIDDGGDLGIEKVDIDVALEASGGRVGVVAVGFSLGGDGELCDLCRRFILYQLLAGATNVEDERVAANNAVKLRMRLDARAAAVEAL